MFFILERKSFLASLRCSAKFFINGRNTCFYPTWLSYPLDVFTFRRSHTVLSLYQQGKRMSSAKRWNEMKLHLTVLSFVPLLILFFVFVLFRITVMSNLLMVLMILWLMIMPFIFLYVGLIMESRESKKKDNEGNAGHVVQTKKQNQQQQ